MKKVIVVGTGGHAKVIADIILKSGDEILGFLDDNYNLNKFINFNFLGKISNYIAFKDEAEFIIAIGDSHIRDNISQNMSGAKWYKAIHPSAVISHIDVKIGEGSVIMANAVLNSCSFIGNHCIINTGSILEHDSKVEDFSHLSVGAKVAGNVTVGKHTWIGVGVNINNNIYITSDCMIGSGCTVVNNITEKGIYVGVPARKLEKEM